MKTVQPTEGVNDPAKVGLTLAAPLIDVRKLAVMLGLTHDAMRKMLSRGQVPHDCILRIGSRVRFDPGRVAAWLERQRMPPKGNADVVSSAQ